MSKHLKDAYFLVGNGWLGPNIVYRMGGQLMGMNEAFEHCKKAGLTHKETVEYIKEIRRKPIRVAAADEIKT